MHRLLTWGLRTAGLEARGRAEAERFVIRHHETPNWCSIASSTPRPSPSRTDSPGLLSAPRYDPLRPVNLKDLQENWNLHGRQDPLWAVLTDPARKGNRWDDAEFFATGEAEIGLLFARMDELGLDPGRGRALDFGCGVGRLTRALANRFEAVDGVDISESMIAEARRRHADRPACRFHVNAADHLDRFEPRSFDFVYSSITLQHVEHRLIEAYLRAFLRVLRPEGLLVFQLPSHRGDGPPPAGPADLPSWKPSTWWYRAQEWGQERRRRRTYARSLRDDRPVIEMFGIPRPDLERKLAAWGAEVLHAERFGDTGDWVSYRYWVRARPRPAAGDNA